VAESARAGCARSGTRMAAPSRVEGERARPTRQPAHARCTRARGAPVDRDGPNASIDMDELADGDGARGKRMYIPDTTGAGERGSRRRGRERAARVPGTDMSPPRAATHRTPRALVRSPPRTLGRHRGRTRGRTGCRGCVCAVVVPTELSSGRAPCCAHSQTYEARMRWR
jgi:hypothetical protein